MQLKLSNSLSLEYERHGAVRDPAILLIMGLGQQLTGWPVDFVHSLVARGWQVIRFDNRDVGLSSRVTGPATIPLHSFAAQALLHLTTKPPYTLHDMAADAIGLLDGLGIGQAHIVGASMGGMIAQILAAEWPARVSSLTSMMSSSGALRYSLNWTPATQALFTPPRGRDNAAILDHLEHIWHLIGSPSMPEPREQLRARLQSDMHRAFDPAGVARQLHAVIANGDRRALLRTIQAPTLVIHGDQDPLVPIGAGEDTAAHIPDARFVTVPGMGHDLPGPLRPWLASAISDHCAAAPGRGIAEPARR